MAEISSMTGSSNRIINADRVNISIDITSVNNRFLEIYLKMPDQLRHLDSKLRSIIQEKLTRGKIDCYLSFALNATDSLNINQDVLHALANAVSQINKELPQSNVNALEILNYPGVISQESNLQEIIDEEILKHFSEAIDTLKENRKKEGIKLKDAITSRLDKIVELTKIVEAQLDKLVETERQRIVNKISTMDVNVNPERLEQEVALAAQRADVREEYDRLLAHVKEVKSILDKGGVCGKRLDFMMQEFNRESNTLASKASNLEITQVAVELKVLVEQMREQVQNIE
ncbi:TIGR00255 family protein [Succinivibrio dextrinosolvens]|uniref:YicC/YloC family endoribonuclease n=1 Tax=Succinivibrio dextrinosolvens TaxID=83771 RepID=UPI0008EA6109|nr:YicC/YloC family endoribonuclease [Succinivibrio dextrinosolvens]SFS48008.1 TIGR00255 family protein [Succinivibrio dextrinosolvens]